MRQCDRAGPVGDHHDDCRFHSVRFRRGMGAVRCALDKSSCVDDRRAGRDGDLGLSPRLHVGDSFWGPSVANPGTAQRQHGFRGRLRS
uniref:LamG domain-containing protein n=2 Tax=Nocardia cyriacigeorgica TaxID=135487 RepID=UPI00397ECC19